MKRLFDFTLSSLGLLILWPVIAILVWIVRRDTEGPGLFRQIRVGRDGIPFVCYKLRTMKTGTSLRPSHEVSISAVTPVGIVLRRTKLDELPQLFNVFRGEMSLVGPRPCLPTQVELVEARRTSGALSVTPGITGLAQIEGVDMSNPARLAQIDGKYARTQTFMGDLTIIWRTVMGQGRGEDRVAHSRECKHVFSFDETNALFHAIDDRAKIIVTGASGFIGQEILNVLSLRSNVAIIGIYRSHKNILAGNTLPVLIENLAALENKPYISEIFRGAKAVIHLAAATPGTGSRMDFELVNVALTATLAKIAAENGVERFVFVSTARVHAELTEATPVSETSPLCGADAYARSKRRAEEALMRISQEAGMAFTIVRPPLVYGPGVKGLLRVLGKAAEKGLPLPLGGLTHNRRDLIGVRNLATFIDRALDHLNAANEAFVICDGAALSTREIVEMMARARGLQARLIPVPVSLLRGFGTLTGAGASFERLIGSFEIDASKAHKLLGWEAPEPAMFDFQRMMN